MDKSLFLEALSEMAVQLDNDSQVYSTCNVGCARVSKTVERGLVAPSYVTASNKDHSRLHELKSHHARWADRTLNGSQSPPTCFPEHTDLAINWLDTLMPSDSLNSCV